MTELRKILSRKFLITLTALIAVFETTHLDNVSKIIIAVVASTYVIAESILDRTGQGKLLEQITGALSQGIAVGRDVSVKVAGDTAAITSSNPEALAQAFKQVSEFLNTHTHGSALGPTSGPQPATPSGSIDVKMSVPPATLPGVGVDPNAAKTSAALDELAAREPGKL